MSSIRSQKLNAASLKFLVKGFLLTKQQEARSPRTVEDYSENLKRFLWYADRRSWPDNVREISQWHIREFLGYVANEINRWDSDTLPARCPASQSTVHHYYRVLRSFFNWIVTEGFMGQSPVAKVKVVSPKPKVIQPYSPEEVKAMVKVCDYDYANGRQFLGARNRVIVLVLYDAGVRLGELANMKLEDINEANGWIRILGKGAKERLAGIEETAQRALWRYLVHRPESKHGELWLTEEGKPLTPNGIAQVIKGLKRRAGITAPGLVHRFRHSFALEFLRIDGNMENLRHLLGHSDLAMTHRYVSALRAEDALQAHKQASPANRLGIK